MLRKFLLACSAAILTIVMCNTGFATTFNTDDLVGTWYGHQVVSGDAPVDDPRWGYGTVVINSSSNYTSTWNSPSSTNEVSTGTVQIDGFGIVGLDNDSLIHGVMNDDKNQIVLTDGSSGSQGNALIVFVKRYRKGVPFILLLLLGE